ncbi:MAG TPA: hypothetical protein VGC84_13410 [Ilumatobacteraceae bacterium]
MNADADSDDAGESGWYVFLTLRGPDDADIEEAEARLVSSDLGGEVQPPGAGDTSLGAIVKVGPMSREDACRLVETKASAVFGSDWSIETRAQRPEWTRDRDIT